MSQNAGPAAPLKELLPRFRGCPVRVSLFDPLYGDRLGRYTGLLINVLPDSLRVDCLESLPAVLPDALVTLELVHGGQFYWCHTRLLVAFPHGSHQLQLSWPERLQTAQQRRHPRVDTSLPVHYTVGESQTIRQGVVVNISAGGVALEGAEQLAPGDLVSLVFALGSGLSFQEIRAEVVRSTATRTGSWSSGMQFVGLRPEQERQLMQWVATRLAAR